jgi:hypothetical protein
MLITEVAKDPYKIRNAKTDPKLKTEQKIVNFIKKNCSTMLQAYMTTNKFLYRGLKNVTVPYALAKIRPDRRPIQMGSGSHEFLTKAFSELGLKVNRQNSIFCSADHYTASMWTGGGDHPYIIFVRDGWTGLVFKKVKKDYAFYKMKNIAEKHMGDEYFKKPEDVKGAAKEIKTLQPNEFNTSATLASVLKTGYEDVLIQGVDYIAVREDQFEKVIWPLLEPEKAKKKIKPEV